MGIIPGLRRALRRNQALLPLLKAILEQDTSYPKRKLAHLILTEVLGEQFLLNEECLEVLPRVMQQIGAEIFKQIQ